RRLSYARLRGRCRRRAAGGLHPLDEGRPRRGARTGSVPAPHGHAALSGPAQIRAGQRETYIGPWLPDPVVEEKEEEDVALPLMLALERLSPLERAAFLLHDVFGLGFEEVATTIQRDPAACRRLAARARTHVREARPRFHVEKQRGLALAEAFFAASRSGDMKALGALLASDVSVHADGGGKRPAAIEPIFG